MKTWLISYGVRSMKIMAEDRTEAKKKAVAIYGSQKVSVVDVTVYKPFEAH
jgi:hypothetical protein